MNKKTISAKPRAASKAPLSPRGKASKNQTAKKPGDANDLAKMLEATLDKKLGEIEKRINERIAKAVDDIKFRIDYAETVRLFEHDGTSLLPSEAIPATNQEATPWPYIVFDRSVPTNDPDEPDKAYIEQQMQGAENCAREIGNRAPDKIGDILDFLDVGESGHFRNKIVERLLNFPRIIIDSEDVKIGALQLFERPTNADEEAALDQKARAPFDKILAAASGYLEKAEAEFSKGKIKVEFSKVIEKFHTTRDTLRALAEALGVCSGKPGERKEASDVAKAVINAAREARRALQDSVPLARFAAELINRLISNKHVGQYKDYKPTERINKEIKHLIAEGYVGAFGPKTSVIAARRRLYRAELLQGLSKYIDDKQTQEC
jgi:hypothetical protein